LAEADSYAIRKEEVLKMEAADLRKRLLDIVDNVEPNLFLETLSVANQTAHRPKVESRDLAHPRFYWVFKNMDYDQWIAQDSAVLLLSGPTICTLNHVSSHILGLMEEGCFENDRIVLSFFSPDGATRGNMPIGRRDSRAIVTIFVHTLLHQLISSTTVSGMTCISAASDFLSHLLDSIDDPGLLARFGNISLDDTSAVLREFLNIPDGTLWDALGNVLAGGKNLRIVVNVSDNMRGQESNFITAVSEFIGDLRKRTSGLKALLTIGQEDDSRMTLGKLPFIDIHYDKERKGLIVLFLDAPVSNVANKCRVP
jgi:hypothetical protein